MRLHINRIPGEIFSKGDGKVAITEMSMIEHRHLNAFSRIYDDACDVGFCVKAKHTNEIVTFSNTKIVSNDDHEMLYWEFEPIVNKNHPFHGWKIIIFND